jgi:hypothetical protein
LFLIWIPGQWTITERDWESLAPPILKNMWLERLLLKPYAGYYSRGFIPEPMHQSSGKSAEYVWEDTALTRVASPNVFSEGDAMI